MSRHLFAIGLATVFSCLQPNAVTGQSRDGLEEALEGLSWRSIGPAEMGGRTTDIAAIPGDPLTVYFATATGGVWKTEDGAITWRSIFESGGTSSVGAIALAPSDPNVLYLGTGEGNPRNSTSIGDGVYRSTDAGETWVHMGLADSERVSRIRVHPRDPDVVYVGAMGHLWGPNEERGVYRSLDGGASWERVLYVDENTGVADLALDPTNPRILYAAMWDFRRRPWTFRSGGPGSGLYRSMDSGDTWEHLNDDAPTNGLPTGDLGRIGVAIAESNPRLVFAIIESNDEGVLWKSEDRGASWSVVSSSSQIGGRPFYYHDIRVDPTDENTLYAVAGGLHKSIDGGRTWQRIAANIHGDHHALWIDPENPDRLINGNDGGFHFSPDGGDTWEFSNTVPLAQFYQIAVDNSTPYNVCGGLQDNDSWCGPSRTRNVAGSLINYWHEIIGPGDGMYVQFDPRNPDLIYANTQGGSFFRVNLATGEARSISPYPVSSGGLPAGAHEYRFNWNAPVHLSPHDPDVVYVGGNVLFRSESEGQSWTEISPDLSRADPQRLGISGGLTPDNTTAEYHATIYTISESPVRAGVIWVGTDDGNVQLTRDGGVTWTELSGRIDVPDGSWVSRIVASRTDPGTAYVTFDRHRDDDMSPYVFATDAYGETWTSIGDGLPTPGHVHVVREDRRVEGLLYVGTETGIWFSLPPSGGSASSGRVWASLRLGLPPVPVRDLAIPETANDLVIGTHGRGAWVLDDAAPIQELGAALAGQGPYLFDASPAVRFEPAIRRFRFDIGDGVFVGQNPPYGALITYYLSGDAASEQEAAEADAADASEADEAPGAPDLDLAIVDAEGDTIRVLEVPGEAGLHRVAWDLRHERFDDSEDGYRFPAAGPKALPGDYTARLTWNGVATETVVSVQPDDRLPSAGSEAAMQVEALRRAGSVGVEAAAVVRDLDDAREQIQAWEARLRSAADTASDLISSAAGLVDCVDSLRVRLLWPDDERAEMDYVPLLPGLSGVMRAIGRATSRPTDPQAAWIERYARQWEEIREDYEEWLVDLAGFNEALAAAGFERIDPGR
ncbi:MAG: hypothetical protein OEU54_00135 [Gemmatimonadota bacterium]|nr:hypothetical protein [Gemmatimonadota bacterium]